MKVIKIDGHRLLDRQSMSIYMKEVLNLPAYFGKTLDALQDCLSEYQEDIYFVIDHKNGDIICRNKYAYKWLMMVGKVSEENPHLKVSFSEEYIGDENDK